MPSENPFRVALVDCEAKRLGVMADLNSKLFVNLGASQTRRRLKGFGHGVKKVETAGNNKAAIIHTATGQHLRQLEAKFTDVGCSETEAGLGKSTDLFETMEPSNVTEEIVQSE